MDVGLDSAASRTAAACVLIVSMAGCNRGASPRPSAPADSTPDVEVAEQPTLSGHDRMLAILKQIAANPPEKTLTYQWESQANQWQRELERKRRLQEMGVGKTNKLKLWELEGALGMAEVRLDKVPSGIDHLLKAAEILAERAAAGIKNAEQRRMETQTWYSLGVAYMRLGENQNCCLLHNAESCILPIQGGGLHTKQEGSKNAIKYFTKVLDQPPEDSRGALEYQQAARWLLNIAYMTIDGYPHDVPEEHRVATEVFETSIDFPRFENVAPKLDLDTVNLCGGAIVDDFDNDGYLDIVTSTWDLAEDMRFFRNSQDGTFEDQTERAGLKGLYGGLNMVQADYDNDGDIDIFVLRGAWLYEYGRHPNSLLRNNGDATFTDVTFEAGLAEVGYPTKTASWADYDNDGDLDLFIANESSPAMYAPNQLFRNNGDGTFVDVANQAGVRGPGFAMGTVWGDFDNDRYPDLYVADDWPASLFRNNRDGTFTDVAEEVNATGPRGAFPVWFWDFNNDSALDLFVSASSGTIGVVALNPLGVDHPDVPPEYRELRESHAVEINHLYQGDGKGGFTEVAKEQNLTLPNLPMGANFGDLDNDGFLDFYLATGDVYIHELQPNLMFLNQGGKGFVNVTMAGGFGHLQKGHGVSFADIDNDGDQDVYVQMGGAFAVDKFKDALFENPGFGNHWLTVKLEGRQSNRSAIGARIHAVIVEDGQERSVYRHVNSGGSFGCNPLRQTLGLGKAERLARLEIYWPTTDKTQVFEEVEMDRVIRIVEGETDYEAIELKRLTLGGAEKE